MASRFQTSRVCSNCDKSSSSTAFSLLQGSAGPQGNPGPKGVRVSTPPAPLSSLFGPFTVVRSGLNTFISLKYQGGVRLLHDVAFLLCNMSASILPQKMEERVKVQAISHPNN